MQRIYLLQSQVLSLEFESNDPELESQVGVRREQAFESQDFSPLLCSSVGFMQKLLASLMFIKSQIEEVCNKPFISVSQFHLTTL